MALICPANNSIPALESLPLPKDINYVITPGDNPKDKAVVACCAPNSVNLVDSCYLWCETSSQYSNKSDTLSQFGGCLRQNNRTTAITAFHEAGAASRAPTVAGVAVAALVAGLMCFA
ncbi:hypothetical protein QBC33DRAFT_545074 [Phialemonium atrogriseum]|uniref:Uncharacterized protein n=1 Tax=Phialemonium atrogriseum TaxID=1093897 RepID=A0AAJ0BVK4_9PEZI|nr:uncharacterized protein QBC33DRAFT_545074 [Phialemonium atrogriseum]KAK1765279.1 hypothetical protein QBC33DRAFT_545074 [Phialemonium atrogriseum]